MRIVLKQFVRIWHLAVTSVSVVSAQQYWEFIWFTVQQTSDSVGPGQCRNAIKQFCNQSTWNDSLEELNTVLLCSRGSAILLSYFNMDKNKWLEQVMGSLMFQLCNSSPGCRSEIFPRLSLLSHPPPLTCLARLQTEHSGLHWQSYLLWSPLYDTNYVTILYR